jgi:hypothetical protein
MGRPPRRPRLGGAGGARSQQIPDALSLFVLKADGPGWLVTHVFGHSNHVGGSACLGIYFLSSMLYFILLIFCSWIPESELMMASSNESNNMSAIQALWLRDLIR